MTVRASRLRTRHKSVVGRVVEVAPVVALPQVRVRTDALTEYERRRHDSGEDGGEEEFHFEFVVELLAVNSGERIKMSRGQRQERQQISCYMRVWVMSSGERIRGWLPACGLWQGAMNKGLDTASTGLDAMPQQNVS